MTQVGTNKRRIKCPCGIQLQQAVLRMSVDWLEQKMIEHWNKRVEHDDSSLRQSLHEAASKMQ